MTTLPATPGVHLLRSDPGRDGALALRTDIAGFAGFAERGPLNQPVLVETMRQFSAVFGDYLAGAELAYAVRAFFENGGRLARIVRIASSHPLTGAAAATLDVMDSAGGLAFTLQASSAGSFANRFEVIVRALTRGETLIPPGGVPEASQADHVTAFAPGDLVRLTQPGGWEALRMVAAVDRVGSRLVWLTPDARSRKPWERALSSFDAAQPMRAERLVHEIALRENGRVVAIWTDLGLHPDSRRFIGHVLPPVDFAAGAMEVVPPLEVRVPERARGIVPLPVMAVSGVRLSGGRDGLAGVTARDMIGEAHSEFHAATGFHALGEARDLSILAVPDVVGRRIPPVDYGRPPLEAPCQPCAPVEEPVAQRLRPPLPEMPPVFTLAEIEHMQANLVELCETLGDRVVILDPPWEVSRGSPLGLTPVADWRRRFASSYAALPFPWLAVPDPGVRNASRAIPPSGHVIGAMAAEDQARGVPSHGANRVLNWVTDTSMPLDDAAHGRLNETNINAIVVMHGRAPRLMGARTLDPALAWRFLTVRRMVCAIRRQLVAALQWAVFAPNDAMTRLMILRQGADYLEMLRKRGALAGAVPDAAYYLRCDETTTTASDRDNGRLIVEIGIAPSVPFEFIVLKLGKSADQLEMSDQSGSLGPLMSEAAP